MTTYDQWKLQGPPEGPPFESWPLRDRIAYWREQIADETARLKNAIEHGADKQTVMKYVEKLLKSYECLIEEE